MEKYFDNSGEEKNSLKRFEEMLKNNENAFFDITTFENVIQHYITQGEFGRAIEICKLGIKQHPYSAELLVELASLQNDVGECMKALETIEKAEVYQPNDAEVLMLKGAILLDLGDALESIECFEKVLPFAEEKDEVYYHLGMAYQQLGEYDLAVECLKDALRVNQKHEDALFELVTCLEFSDQLESSVGYYESFIDNNPYNVSAWYNLGIVHDKLCNYEKAIQAYEYAVVIDDKFSSAYFNMGATLMTLDRDDEALKCFEKTLELEDWQDAQIYFCVANCHRKLLNYDKAITFFQKCIGIDETHEAAYYGIGEALDAQERWYESIHFFKKAVSLSPENGHYLYVKGKAEYKIGNLVTSLEDFAKASEFAPGETDLWLDWSFILYEQGDTGKAIDIIELGMEENPESAELIYRLTAYLLQSGNYKQAFIYLENALILNFEKHVLLFEFFPELETQKALIKIIDQFK